MRQKPNKNNRYKAFLIKKINEKNVKKMLITVPCIT
jgi:hypothetical protein